MTKGGQYMRENEFLTVDECASLLKMSSTTIYRLARQNKLPGTKIGNQWRFSKKLIEEWIEKKSRKMERKNAG